MSSPPTPRDHATLLATLRQRFEHHMQRHPEHRWPEIAARLQAAPPAALQALHAMEDTGGEPDVVALPDVGEAAIVWCDCAAESPAGRRSLCFDAAALDARKENRPQGSATAMARAMGVALLTEAQYHALQQLGAFDLKTSSWVATRLPCARSAARCSATAVMAGSSRTTTGRSRTTRPGAFARCWPCEWRTASPGSAISRCATPRA